MQSFGLLGEKLSHSFSPQIHSLLADYEYGLYPVEREDLELFLAQAPLDGMNVTIPYKKEVLPMCAWMSDAVRRIGSANTLVKKDNGWHAYNTDYMGFRYMVESSGCFVKGEKVLVLGSGGASLAVCAALEDMQAGQIVVISRSGENNYNNLHLHKDAAVVVNTTPVGMYPDIGISPVELTLFPHLTGVLDVVYNPLRTALFMQAEARGIPCSCGLPMLAAQAWRAAELFTGTDIPVARMEQVLEDLTKERQNIVLIGMPGCGKSTVGTLLAKKLGRDHIDLDRMIEEKSGKPIPAIFAEDGEAFFRALETQCVQDAGQKTGCVISTGGGVVTREENYSPLHQNGIILHLTRKLDLLPTDGRPISQKTDMAALWQQRKALYERFADRTIRNNGTPEETLASIEQELMH